jgi:hypothetical protein
MDKLEKKYIKNTVKKILEIKEEALQYNSYDFSNRYEIEVFSEKTYSAINYNISEMMKKCYINTSIINKLVNLNLELLDRNIQLIPTFKSW